MKPTLPLHDPRFRYTNAANTDIRKTFARFRREQEKAKAEEAQQAAEAHTVTPTKRKVKA